LKRATVCLKFDGENDYVEIPNSTSLETFSAITVSCWFKAETLGDGIYYRHILDKGWQSEGAWVLYTDKSSKKLYWVLRLDDAQRAVYSDTELEEGVWYHVVGVYDGQKVQLYINGVKQTAETNYSKDSFSNTAPLKIAGSTYDHHGIIDEIRIYNRALTEKEIKYLYHKTSPGLENLALSLPLNEGSGTIAYDKSLYGNNGTIHGASWTDGKYDKALSFDGENDYIFIDKDTRTINEITASVWIKSDVQQGVTNHCFIFKPTGGTSLARWELSFHNGEELSWYLYNGSSASNITWTGIEKNVWTHIVIVFKADQRQEIWINGELKANKISDFAGGVETDRNIELGSKGWWGSDDIFYKGIIDDVRIYYRALTQEEIEGLYAERKIQDGLVLYLGKKGLICNWDGSHWKDFHTGKQGTIYGAKRVKCCPGWGEGKEI